MRFSLYLMTRMIFKWLRVGVWGKASSITLHVYIFLSFEFIEKSNGKFLYECEINIDYFVGGFIFGLQVLGHILLI